MNYQLTIFKNQFDNKTHRRLTVDSWSDFVDLLGGLSQKRGQKGGGNNSSPLISPAVYTEGTTRSNKNVVYWGGWAAVDVDDYIMDSAESALGLEKVIRSRFSHWDFVCYSTASSKIEKPKFRLVFRLNQHVSAEKIRHFWHALNKELGEIGDEQTKDLSRMYYVPAIYPNAHNFIFAQTTNKPIDVDSLLEKHPYTEKTGNGFLDKLPLELQKAIIEHRKNQLQNTNIRWTSYRDCPFWPRMLAAEYQQISETGWYHKMYQIMVATAGNAIKCGYPITANEIANLCREFDKETGNWYENRPLAVEANSALTYVYRNG